MSAISAIRKYDQYLMGNDSFSLKGPYNIEAIPQHGKKTAGLLPDEDEQGFQEREPENADILDKYAFERRKRENAAKVAAAKEKDALAVVRYAVQSLLRWTPRDAAEHLTPEIVQKLKLDEVIKYVIYPPDLSRADDRLSGYRWLLHKAFPAEVGYDIKYQALGIYEQVRTGKLKQFPRYLFRGPDSRRKLAIMLLDYISRCIPASDVEDLYIKFSNPLAGVRILKKASLYYAYKEMFESPILFLHYALGDSGDPFLFNYYLFADVERAMKAEKEAEEKEKKKKAAEAIKSEG